MDIKKELRKPMKGWILDVGLMVIALVIISIVFVLFAAMWLQFRTGIDNQATNSTLPLNSTTLTQINGLGNGFFLTNGQDIILLFWFALIVALFISASVENATFLTIPIGVILMVPIMLISFIGSDLAHAFLTSPSLTAITGTYYSGILYLTDNLPVVSGVLCIVYLVLVVLTKGRGASGGGGTSSQNIVSG